MPMPNLMCFQNEHYVAVWKFLGICLVVNLLPVFWSLYDLSVIDFKSNLGSSCDSVTAHLLCIPGSQFDSSSWIRLWCKSCPPKDLGSPLLINSDKAGFTCLLVILKIFKNFVDCSIFIFPPLCGLQGTKLEIPLWLAKGLYDNKRRILSVELPKIYRESWRTVFSADANVIDLHKLGPFYYGFGSQLLNFDSPENAEIAQTILQVKLGTWQNIAGAAFCYLFVCFALPMLASLCHPWLGRLVVLFTQTVYLNYLCCYNWNCSVLDIVEPRKRSC